MPPKITNIGLAIATQPDSATSPRFNAESQNHYANVRASIQEQRTQDLKLQAAEHNLDRAIFEQGAAENTQRVKQNELIRAARSDVKYANAFDELSTEWSSGIESPDKVTDKWLRQQRDKWTALTPSKEFGGMAKTRLAQITARGAELHGGKMLKNSQHFEDESINGRAWKTMDQIPEDVSKFYDFTRVQTSDRQQDPERARDPQSGQLQADGSTVSNGIEDCDQ